jgi:hypothetical protein
MKQETFNARILITTVCTFGAAIILGMFAAAGYL